MDTYRAFLAIVISFVILIGYQYFFVGFAPEEVPVGSVENQENIPPAQNQQQVLQQPQNQQSPPHWCVGHT